MDDLLTRRQEEEKAYHDNIYKNGTDSKVIRTKGGKHYDYFWKAVGDVEGKNVLDFGCGNGWVSIKYAKNGAFVWGFDISDELVKSAKEWAIKESLSESITFGKMAAENLSYENNFFDLIVGSAILHHTEIEVTLRNIKRVMKPDGKAIFIEPMNRNIFLQIWRKMTPNRRSQTEKALKKYDLMLIENIFPRAKIFYSVP